MEKLLSKKELAQHFNVCYRTVCNWRKQGVITPQSAVNGRDRYKLQDLKTLTTPKNINGESEN